MRPIDRFVDRLKRVKDRGHGKYMACCPAHDDKSPSLSIQEAEDGRVLVRCFAGCAVSDIVLSMGLELRDLFPVNGTPWEQISERKRERLLIELQRESDVLDMAANAAAPLSAEDRDRAQTAQQRVGEIIRDLGRTAGKSRQEIQDRIDATDDFDVLTVDILAEVEQAAIPEPARVKLKKAIAQKAGISVKALDGPGAKPAASATPDFVKEMNQKHAVMPVSGRVLIMNQEYDAALDRAMVTFSSQRDFLLRYSNRRQVHQGEEVDHGTLWLQSPERRQYEGLVFAPAGAPAGYFNLFQGFAVEPVPGAYGMWADMVRDVICCGDEEIYDYVVQWMAHLVQRPGELPKTAIVLRGRQGTGKNTFVDTLGRLCGRHYVSVSSLGQVTGRFSGHLADALLVFANEAVWGGDKTAEGALKAIVTDDISTIERKGQDAIPVRNYKRLIVASNEDWAVPRGMDDRRFLVLDVSDSRRQDTEYFAAIRQELDAGGYAAIMDWLSRVDLSDWRPGRLPEAARHHGWDLKIQSGGSVLQWWFECLDRGAIGTDDQFGNPPGWPTPTIAKAVLYADYLGWCQARQVRHPAADVPFSRELVRYGIKPTRRRIAGERERLFLIPDLDSARVDFGGLVGIPDGHWGG